MISIDGYNPSRSLPARLVRRMTQWRVAAPLNLRPKRTIVSFTFDDFPKSAADTGADILGQFDATATYYACSGLSGKSNDTGEQYNRSDIEALIASGHEIGAHTHSHLDCAKASVKEVKDDIAENLARLRDMGAPEITQLAYPYGETNTPLKRALTGHFETVRGVLAGTNSAASDRMQLRALELTPEDCTTERAAAAIKAAEHVPSWVVIFTHDVQALPSRYGTTPNALRRLAHQARESGAEILNISEAMAAMQAHSRG